MKVFSEEKNTNTRKRRNGTEWNRTELKNCSINVKMKVSYLNMHQPILYFTGYRTTSTKLL